MTDILLKKVTSPNGPERMHRELILNGTKNALTDGEYKLTIQE